MVWSENMRIFNTPHLKNTDDGWVEAAKCQKCTASSQARVAGQVGRIHHQHLHQQHHQQHHYHRRHQQQQLQTQPTNGTRASSHSKFSKSHALAICAAIIILLPRDAGAQLADGKSTTSLLNTYDERRRDDRERSAAESDVTEAASWSSVADESCYFVAAPGLFFNRSVLEEMKRREEDPLKDDDFVKVYFMESQLNDWLTYDEDTQMLQGIPNSDFSEAPTQNFVIALYRNNSAVRRRVTCSIGVTSDVSEYDDNAMKSGSASLRCASYEPITVFSLTLSAKSRLSKHAKLNVFQNLCRLIQKKIISCNSIVIEEEKEASKMSRLVQSSRSRSADKRAQVVEVWWPIACGSDSLSPSTFSEISKAADNGTLAEILGVDIYNWNIGNRADDKARYAAKSLRIGQKRHFSKMLGSMSPSRTSIYEFDTMRMKRSDLSSSGDDDTYNEHTVPEGTSKPSLSHLQSPTVAPTSAGTPVARASRPPDHDNPPFVNVHDLTLQGIVGTLMKFKLPGKTFFDKEDGGIENLGLNVIHITEDQKVATDSWLRVDKKTLSLYGVPPESSTDKEGRFLLQATDSSNFTATTRINISISPRKRNKTNHRFVVSSIYNDPKLSKEIQASIWMRHLSNALFRDSGEDLPTNPPEDRLTLIKHDRGDKRITMTWTDNELNSQSKCDMRKINQRWKFMTGEKSVGRKNSDRRVRASEKFSRYFEPDFTMDKVKVVLSGTCSPRGHATTRPRTLAVTPITATTIPTIVASISVPQVLHPSKVWQMTVDMGRLTKVPIDTADFYLPDMTYFKLVTLEDRESPVPSWIRVDNEHRQLVALPFANSFPKTINFKAVWQGGLVASIGHHDSDPLNVTITADRRQTYEIEGLAGHKFQLDILNYDAETFKVREYAKLLDAIREMYGDNDASNIYVLPPTATTGTGTFEISWTNATTAVIGPCDVKVTSQLGWVLIEGGGDINRGFELLLEKAGFEVGSIRMVRLNECLKATFPTTTTTNVAPTTTTLCTTVSTGITTETATPTTRTRPAMKNRGGKKIDSATVGNDAKAKQSSASTPLIIMVTVFTCAILLMALCCFMKFRSERKMKEVRTTLGGKLSLGTGGRDFTYKRGTPIVFDGELDNNQEMMEMNGTNTNHPSTSPLLNDRVIQQNQTSSFFQSAAPKNQKDDAIIDLTLQSANSGVPSEIERPPPPPYLLKSVGPANGYDH